MAEYRAFTIDPDGHIDGVQGYTSPGDDDAIAWASQWLVAKPLEIWSGDRFVKRLEPDGDHRR